MTRKAELYRDLIYNPDAAAECSSTMREWLAELKHASVGATGPPRLFSAETVAGALALANKGAARNLSERPL